jgi:uncharacterized protein (DUF983 family)
MEKIAAGLMLRRAVRVRCPHCGAGGVLEHWLRLRPHCPSCLLCLDRGERDHFIGAYMLNLVLALTIAAVFLLGAVALTWPDVPWRVMGWLGLALMVAAPLALYPVSKLLWLAIDLIFRAPSRADFAPAPPEPRQ